MYKVSLTLSRSRRYDNVTMERKIVTTQVTVVVIVTNHSQGTALNHYNITGKHEVCSHFRYLISQYFSMDYILIT